LKCHSVINLSIQKKSKLVPSKQNARKMREAAAQNAKTIQAPAAQLMADLQTDTKQKSSTVETRNQEDPGKLGI
jgi:hypothetical protein